MEDQKMISNYITRIEAAIDAANSGRTKLTEVELTNQGMSSRKNRIFLNGMIVPETRYLEIGTWFGSTFISSLYKNTYESAIAIDNFSLFNGNQEKFLQNCARSEIDPFVFFNADCFNLTPEMQETIKNVDVYFYDGEHTEEDQYKALTYYIDKLTPVFVYICDDWNHVPAKDGTRKAIKDLGLIVHKEWELPANYNGDTENWWHGLYVAVMEKSK